jgi:hypothetical protein
MSRIIGITALMGLFLTACVTMEPVVTYPVSSTNGGTPAGYYYSIPRTVLRVEFRLQHTIFIPGPYAAYASKYLGIVDVARTPKNEWAIKGADISEGIESDPQLLFCIQPALTDVIMPSLYALEKEGYILSPGLVYYPRPSQLAREDYSTVSNPTFTDLSSSRYFNENIDTVYKTVMKDSKYIRVPTVRKEIEQKTPELKAQEAANFIIKIRKRRFKLLSGQYNFITEGAALEITVRELNKLEEEYLSLFIGKQITVEKRVSQFYIPDMAAGGRADILCRFSEDTGILPEADKHGQPVLIRVLDENSLADTINNSPRKISQALYYRMPGNAAVSLTYGEQIVAQNRMSLAQFGPLITLPLPEGKKVWFKRAAH